ncbi:alpha/beta hydrolase fold domain-containing protein [Streptomyces sp. NPDC059761]|uniref:alpha/beta hydrolase fold domain-containing protein n=1 Tax=Streptomyces sp. NPDC059761 TaxID=3346937 RepID=UPI003665ED9A
MRHAADWGIDPARIAVFGESCGALIAALAAIRAGQAGLQLRAQVLVNPVADVTGTMFDHPSVTEHAHGPTLTAAQLRLLHRLAVPSGTDPRALSPLHAGSLSGLAPALVVLPGDRPAEGQAGRGLRVRDHDEDHATAPARRRGALPRARRPPRYDHPAAPAAGQPRRVGELRGRADALAGAGTVAGVHRSAPPRARPASRRHPPGAAAVGRRVGPGPGLRPHG